MLKKSLLAFPILLCSAIVSQAAPTIIAPDLVVPSGVLVEFFISTSGGPGDAFQGVDLNIEIMPSGASQGPIITVLDMTSAGLLFFNNSIGQTTE